MAIPAGRAATPRPWPPHSAGQDARSVEQAEYKIQRYGLRSADWKQNLPTATPSERLRQATQGMDARDKADGNRMLPFLTMKARCVSIPGHKAAAERGRACEPQRSPSRQRQVKPPTGMRLTSSLKPDPPKPGLDTKTGLDIGRLTPDLPARRLRAPHDPFPFEGFFSSSSSACSAQRAA